MLGIKRLHVMIIKQFALLFVGTFFISLFVLMMQFVWQYVDTLIGKGLTLDILGQFFWYMSLMMVPQALPLAILLSSLITFGNLGETSELTAIKAAGISLMQTLTPLAIIVVGIACGSFYFQNNVGPESKKKMARLLISMKQKSPELEIPEGIFYDGIPQCNIYVQRKDMDTGMLYGIMIYRMTGSYDDAAIILADSGMLQSTAEKKHLLLNLYSGEWFENMRSSELGGGASVPYRRETFWKKRIVIDFDGDFNLADANAWGQNAQGKSLSQIRTDIDSLNHIYDSIGRAYFNDAKRVTYAIQGISKADSLRALQASRRQEYNIDSLYNKLSPDKRRQATNNALSKVNQHMSELDFKSMVTDEGDYDLRQHKIEALNKFVLALSCIIFFFIGAPLGAIIRKGGLGIPIIVSVVVFIIFYILDNTGYRMARGGMWTIWFGKGLATAVLAPTAAFVTYKANNDSAVFNLDAYVNLGMRILGMRRKRSVQGKEVIINDPDYPRDVAELERLSSEVTTYAHEHNLKSPPNIIKVFFKYQPDHEIERISEELEAVIEDLGNTRDRMIISLLGRYPVVSEKAHTRPFERKWLNIMAAILVPLGAFLYIRMWTFRLRLLKDLRVIKQNNANIIGRIKEKDLVQSTTGNDITL
ncbi:MAG: LptF/LptG family permease [Prevotella sp.]|nr:LptF/LptG family permease [Prevotella sp.]MBO4658677.1 LptF/LptG family permease [Prevotella sp.]